jgi:hypothetical protein
VAQIEFDLELYLCPAKSLNLAIRQTRSPAPMRRSNIPRLPVLAQVGHAGMSALTPLLGAKQTSRTIIRARAKERPFLILAEGSGLAIQRSDGAISAHVFRDGFPVHEISLFAVGQRDYNAGRFSSDLLFGAACASVGMTCADVDDCGGGFGVRSPAIIVIERPIGWRQSAAGKAPRCHVG